MSNADQPRIQPTRREFIRTTGILATGVWLGVPALAAVPRRSRMEGINFACIGVGGKGDSDTADAARHGNVVALCDIDDATLARKGEHHPDAMRYSDFREMLDVMGDRIDAVTVSTPDHTHAVASIAAMKLGKHCFCQKPLTWSIHEARRMGDLARMKNLATQMGNQGTASNALRKAAAIVRAGALGQVRELHVWTNRPIWPQGVDRPEPKEAPGHVKWDLWIGPAPYRDYAEFANGRSPYHPFNWRGWWNFGTGALGDMACHTLNMPFMALDLRNPTSVEAESSGHNHDSFPKWSRIRYEFAATNERPSLSMIWYDGGQQPDEALLGGEKMEASGALIIGEHGSLYAPGDGADRYALIGDVREPEVEHPRSPGHFAEFARAISGGEPAMSNFPDYASPLTETVLLGNLALWAGKRIEWDSRTLKATNAPEVMKLVHREYRDGWEV